MKISMSLSTTRSAFVRHDAILIEPYIEASYLSSKMKAILKSKDCTAPDSCLFVSVECCDHRDILLRHLASRVQDGKGRWMLEARSASQGNLTLEDKQISSVDFRPNHTLSSINTTGRQSSSSE